MSLNKEDILKLSIIVGDYVSPEKLKREESEKQLKELRNKNMGVLSLCLLELSSINEFSEQIKLTSLVLLRKIIELDSKEHWGNIDPTIKEKIKLSSLNIIFNNNINNNRTLINNAISVVEQILTTIIDFNEEWPELFQISNNIFNLQFPKDIDKIYSTVKLLKSCVSFLSNKLFEEINKLNNYFLPIFQSDIINSNQTDINNIEKILELKVIICSFYSELLTYNIDDISNIAVNNYVVKNITNTLNNCIFFLKKRNISKIESITSNMLDSMDFLTSMRILDSFPESQIQLCQLYYSIIDLKDINLQKLKEQCFQKILDIFLLKTLPKEELENSLKKYLDYLFLYVSKDLSSQFNESNEEFSNISGNYTNYEKVPKIFYDVLNFMFEITSQIIEENEKNIIKELSISLINNSNIIYKYTGLMIFPQVIESCNKFSEIKPLVPKILENINNQNNQIRYAASYSLGYLVENYKNHFIKKYSEQFLTILIKSIKTETCLHTKCEMILLFNSYISQLDDEIDDDANNDTDDEDEFDENKNINNNPNNNINVNMTAKEYINKNCKEIFEFLFHLFEDSLNKGKDNENSLVKEVLLNTILTCIDYYGEKCKPYSIKYIEYLAKYLDNIYIKKINDNLYIGLLNCISSFGKYQEDYLAKLLPSLFKCLEEIFQKIKENTPNINQMQTTLTNLLPIIINKNNELIPVFIKDILELIEYALNQGDESNINYLEDVNSILKALSSSIEILEDKCLNFIPDIEKIIIKIIQKYKNNSDIHTTVINILYNFLKIISENKTLDKDNLIKMGKRYLDISVNMIKNEYKTSTCVILTEYLNKIMENIISFIDQNELEQLFNGIIQLIELFEGKRLNCIKKKNKKENEKEEKEENKKEEDEDTLSSLDDEYDDTDENIINSLNNDILRLEQVIENFSLIIENILKYGNKKYLNNIYNVLYNKIIPSLISSIDNIPLLRKYQNNLKIAANLIDDIFEYSDFNNLNQNYIDKLIDILINLTSNEKPNIRQSAAYGLGIFIKLSDINNIYPKYSKNILQALKISYDLFFKNKIINDKKEELLKREDGLAYDNIIASLGKAVGYKNLDDKNYINLWIDNLPIQYDETEMEEGHNILCEFILNNKHKLYNLDEEHYYKIIKILLNVYKEKNLTNGDIDKKIKDILKNKKEFSPIIENIYSQYKTKQKNKNINKYIEKIEEITK